MPMGKKKISPAFTVFFYCNFFIAGCAAALIYETIHLLKLFPGTEWFIWLAFFCTVNIYTFHYYLKSLKPGDDDRLIWYRTHKHWIRFLLFAGSCVISYLVFIHFKILFGYQNIIWTLLIPLLSLTYSLPILPGGRALRHVGWLKLPLLSFVWSFTTVLLPIFYSEKKMVDDIEVQAIFINRLFFVMALCVLFNVRDYEEDKNDNVMTPAVVLGPEKILTYGKWILTIVNIATAVLLIRVFKFQTVFEHIAIAVPVVLLFLLFQFFSFKKSEIEFLILNDGLMPVKALLLIFATGLS
jgi:hypothetical protein